MTKEEELAKLKEIRKKHGTDSSQYLDAYNKFKKKYGAPGLRIILPSRAKNTNTGSPSDDSSHYGAKKRNKKSD